MSNTNENSDFDVSSDRAIESRNQDCLERKGFANRIGQLISKRKGRDSFVISLQGPWGCGKSSVKNMVLEWLRNDCDEKERPIIVEFEPWQYRDSDSLFQGFFDEVISAISSELPNSPNDTIVKLKQYNQRVARKGYIIGVFGEALAFTPIAPVGKVASMIAGMTKKHVKSTQSKIESLENDSKNLHKLKRELRDSMQHLERLLLIVIDDMDRLYADEMARVFQLVKANADFPNFVYLLVFHHEIVEKSIEEVIKGSGREYLEKIVQKPITIPNLNQHQVNTALENALEKLSNEYEISFDINLRTSILHLLNNGLSDLIHSLRDVNRVVNALDFSWSFFISDGSVEVNLVDLLALETLRIYEPDVYALLPVYKSVLLNKSMSDKLAAAIFRSNGTDVPAKANERNALTNLLNASTEQNRPAVRQILQTLFVDAAWPEPVAEGTIRWPKDMIDRPNLLTSLRVRDEHYFDRYFAYSLTEKELSEVEVTTFLQNVGNQAISLTQLKLMEEKMMAELFLTRIQDRNQEVKDEDLVSAIKTLFVFGEQLKVQPGNRHFDIIPYIESTIHLLIVRQPDIEKNFARLVQAFRETEAFCFPTFLVFRSHQYFSNRNAALADETTMKICENILREKIKNAAERGLLNNHRHLLILLEVWGKGYYTQGDSTTVKNFIEAHIENVDNLVHLLKQLGESVLDVPVYATDGNVLRGNILNRQNLLPMNFMLEKLRCVKQESLTDSQREIVEPFLPLFEQLLNESDNA